MVLVGMLTPFPFTIRRDTHVQDNALPTRIEAVSIYRFLPPSIYVHANTIVNCKGPDGKMIYTDDPVAYAMIQAHGQVAD